MFMDACYTLTKNKQNKHDVKYEEPRGKNSYVREAKQSTMVEHVDI